jgi:Mor family transcriptional regulator
MANAPEAREQLLARMVEVIREETGLHERFARPMAEGILRRLGDEFRGERVYLGEDRETVYQQAIAEFNGRNRDAVCAKYGMSRATFYRVLNRGREHAPAADSRAGGAAAAALRRDRDFSL